MSLQPPVNWHTFRRGIGSMGDSGTNQTIATNVRNWLHYDTLASSLYKQATRARQVRDEFETKVITTLHEQRMENAVIQINSGVLNVVEERTPRTLTFTGIEQMLHMYFQHKGSGARDDTKDIMNFFRKHRGYTTLKRLRKSGGVSAPPLPPPPQPPIAPPPPGQANGMLMNGGGRGGAMGGGGGGRM